MRIASAASAQVAQLPTAAKDEAAFFDTVLAGTDAKSDLVRTYSVNEINRYLSKMDAADIATTLKLFRAMELLKSGYVEDVSSDKLLSGALKGTVNALGDPHSVYLDPKMYQEFMIETKGSFSGIGITLGMKDKVLTVVAPIDGTPADKAGLMSGDQILKIDGQDTKEMALDEAVSRIRGLEGTQVTLSISRAGQEAREYTITRANIQLKTVNGKMLDNGIAYIRISMFNDNTGDDFAKKLLELEGQDLKAVVLDLRNNPGGLIEECVKVAGHFVPKGPIVSVVTRDGTRKTHLSRLDEPKYPLVVLVNGGSASAAEIVAGAVQDTGVGTLVGTKTYGKGSVQTVVRLDNNSAVKFTIAKYFTPKDRSIDGAGIEPDIEVLLLPDGKEVSQDVQLDKAIEVLQEKLGQGSGK
jgi:carboxyl-terminal processing protease